MESNLTQNELLAQVDQFWSMLDDMLETNPERYQKFIERHMKEGREFMASPELHLCLQTKILVPEERVLYINICKWKRIPAPESETHPVPLSAGRLETLCEGAVIDIAYSPDVLKKAELDPVETDQLIRLAMKYIEQQHKVSLCHSYHITPFKLKGDMQRMKDSLQSLQKVPDTKARVKERAGNVSLLDELKNIAVNGEENEATASPPIQLTKSDGPRSARPCLIEEISSSENEELLRSPPHELAVTKDEAGKPQTITLKVELMDICSVSECDLSVSKDDLMLEVPGRYRLHLNLPQAVNEETVKAKFNKANRVLLVSMSI